MNTEAHKFSEHCEVIFYSCKQSDYDAYRLKQNLPLQPVQFITQAEKEAIREVIS